ncbi:MULTISPECIES: hypothetical protein [Corynebacterium]|uniref:Uncharacterized protein n=3 Tax=Corynebacterium TaxID=1716 RepID=A0ABD0BJA9_CORUL|nr:MULTISPECIES: hypothetical protein [Corynebacterium]AEG81208.1 hypothetical protein CULC809_00672 [Corynebacterium ulcerans 809]AEG83397.1 hypothetical protein CULC22_00684 [Corynebacterium ulcerans BR-AD22]AIT88666.1 Hypothetical protein Cul210932_0708 [Corynebacterium ulcerans]AIU30032.1 Hypothetical protein Cul210931_0676 [Corynebacterium ulcerans]AIU32265.1 Hypothetical protein CulFRC11_0677 [Corynebacterium ramonii FRC0011]
MTDKHPIFHDVERRAITATVVEEKGTAVLALDETTEDGTSRRILTLNKFDAKQLSAVCDRYLHQQHSIDYANVNALLTEVDRAALYDDEDDE